MWFGRELTDAQFQKVFSENTKPRSIQHALVQIDERIRKGDPEVPRWYPQVASLSDHPLPLIRAEAAWVMGQDSRSELFHQTLLTCLEDSSPLVRRNAALALVRFRDLAALDELRSMLKNWPVRSSVAGRVEVRAEPGQWVHSDVELAVVLGEDGSMTEIRTELRGRILEVTVVPDQAVAEGKALILLSPDPEHVWESLRGLYLMGTRAELELVESCARNPRYTEELRRQARATAEAIRESFPVKGTCLPGKGAETGFNLIKIHHVNRVPGASVQKGILGPLADAQLTADAKQRVDFNPPQSWRFGIGDPHHAVLHRTVVNAGRRSGTPCTGVIDHRDNARLSLALVGLFDGGRIFQYINRHLISSRRLLTGVLTAGLSGSRLDFLVSSLFFR